MFMKKKILLALPFAIALATFTFVGCGGSDGTSAEDCHHQAYCLRTTDKPNKTCDAGKTPEELKNAKDFHEARVKQAKEAGVFQEEFEECWDM